MSRSIHIRSAVALCALIAAWPATGRAQGTARSMDFDVSIPAAGMGGASNAAFWVDVDHWANPALLGYAEGVRYLHTRTQLVPGLATDVILSTDAVQFGSGGLGIVHSGRPGGMGGVHLDYGESEATDPFGNPTGTFHGFERVWSKGVGISLLRAIETGYALAGHEPPALSRYGDVSAGMNWKDVTVALAPGFAGGTRARDWGVHARITPVDGFATRGAPLRIDVAGGVSVLSYNDDAVITFPSVESAPVSRHHRRGGAARLGVLAWPAPAPSADALERIVVSGLSPLVSVSYAYDHDEIGSGSSIDFTTNGSGGELSFANVLFMRLGHFEDRVGQIVDTTWGWGVALPFGAIGGLRYDEAWFPQSGDLPHVHRRGFSIRFDPFALERWRRGGGAASI